MIVKDSEAIKRLTSPMNLINQLRNGSDKRNNAMQLFGIGRSVDKQSVEESKEQPKDITTFNPFKSTPTNIPAAPALSDILENSATQISLGLAHDSALKLLNNSVDALSTKLDDVRADKLPAVITAASKVVESIRRERNEAMKNGKDKEVHFHFYTPEQKKLSDYNVIDVT